MKKEKSAGAVIINDKKVLLLHYSSGHWDFPKGHIEKGETELETAKREVKEETGLDIKDFEIISISDDLRYIETDGKQYVTIGIKAKFSQGEPKVMEPEKCERWQWMGLNNLPDNIFEGTHFIIQNFLNKRLYIEPR